MPDFAYAIIGIAVIFLATTLGSLFVYHSLKEDPYLDMT